MAFLRETGFGSAAALIDPRINGNPLSGIPLGAAAGLGKWGAHFDDFVQYAGPAAAGAAGGYAVLVSTVTQHLVASPVGAGVLSISTGGQLASENTLYARLAANPVILAARLQASTPAADTIGIGFVTAGTNLAAADGVDEIVLEIDGPAGQLQMRTQRAGGGVTTTPSTNAALNAKLVAGGNAILVICDKGAGGVEGWVSTTDGETWTKAITIAGDDLSLPNATTLDVVYTHIAGTGPALTDWALFAMKR